MNLAKTTTVLLTIVSTISPVAAQSIDDMVAHAKLSLAAWECSYLAPSREETDRLFSLGYKSGKTFLQMLESNPLDADTRRWHFPVAWTLPPRGPTPDFVLGSIYTDMRKQAYLGLRTADLEFRYHEKNCALLAPPNRNEAER